ncbi:MAG TPA: hypothetical protein V6C82_06525, partial [Chroococcales cyanobacterium]
GKLRRSERISKMVLDTIENSFGKPHISMSPPMREKLLGLRTFMFERVYLDSLAKKEEKKAQRLLSELYHYFLDNPEELAAHYHCESCADNIAQHAVDFIAGMTDPYALMKYKEIFFPRPWRGEGAL